MGGGGGHDGHFHVSAPHLSVATVMTTLCWVWIMWRGYEDGAVVLVRALVDSEGRIRGLVDCGVGTRRNKTSTQTTNRACGTRGTGTATATTARTVSDLPARPPKWVD